MLKVSPPAIAIVLLFATSEATHADACQDGASAWQKKAAQQGELNIAAFKRMEIKLEKGDPGYCTALKILLETTTPLAKEYQELERMCGRAPLDGVTSQTLAY